MKNIIDYVSETKDLQLSTKPFCAADSLVLAQLAYLDYGGIIPPLKNTITSVSLAEAIHLRGLNQLSENTVSPDKNRKLLSAISKSSRFRDLKACFFINELDPVFQKQFSAVTFILPNGLSYAAFRGTDATLIGWKEDFNMTFTYPVPAQARAAAYIDQLAEAIDGQFLLGGHSKGGNLAIYAAVKCEASVHRRIQGVFNHDGPGFIEKIYSEPQYTDIADKIHTSIPTHSIVGILLNHDEHYQVVKSSSIGLLQHDPFTWGIKEQDLLYTTKLGLQSTFYDKAINRWLETINEESRKRFVDALFEVASTSNIQTLRGVRANWRKTLIEMINAIKGTDEDTRRFILGIMLLFVKSMNANLKNDLRQRIDMNHASRRIDGHK